MFKGPHQLGNRTQNWPSQGISNQSVTFTSSTFQYSGEFLRTCHHQEFSHLLLSLFKDPPLIYSRKNISGSHPCLFNLDPLLLTLMWCPHPTLSFCGRSCVSGCHFNDTPSRDHFDMDWTSSCLLGEMIALMILDLLLPGGRQWFHIAWSTANTPAVLIPTYLSSVLLWTEHSLHGLLPP